MAGEEAKHLSVAQVAAELGCDEQRVRALIREGELDTLKCGIRPGLIARREVDAYVRRVRSGRARA